jgi:hypothetical protein
VFELTHQAPRMLRQLKQHPNKITSIQELT